MPYLGDTNILLRFTNANDPEHEMVADAVRSLGLQGETVYYTQQNRREFWNVCTRPAASNGLGYSIPETLARLDEVDAVFTRLSEHPQYGPEWDRLVTHYGVTGRAVHDAQLVASMLTHGITHILTLNIADFTRYTEITAVHPGDLQARELYQPPILRHTPREKQAATWNDAAGAPAEDTARVPPPPPLLAGSRITDGCLKTKAFV